jgi:hypothetical protein
MSLTQHFHERHPLKRIVHLFLLLGWLLSSQGVAPAFCLAAAQFDGGHRVKVGASTSGELTVVLSHESVVHEHADHDLLCEMLMVFAVTPAFGGTDHILAFKSVDVISRVQRDALNHQAVVHLRPSVAPFILVHRFAPCAVVSIKNVRAPAWSSGLALKAGKTIMLC